jgi:hypothetical protein
MEKKVSAFHTFVFFNICLFFSFIALHWELKHRRGFRRLIRPGTLTEGQLESALEDFARLKSCEDPYIEHFISRHPEFSMVNRLWLINSCGYWQRRYRRELKRRGPRA